VRALSLSYIGHSATGYPTLWMACILPHENVAVWIRIKWPPELGNDRVIWFEGEVLRTAGRIGIPLRSQMWEGMFVRGLSPIELLSLPYYDTVLDLRYSPEGLR
jgi:hypothetical protein